MEKLNIVARVLDISKGKIKDMCKSDEITFEIVNGVYYVDLDEVKNQLEKSVMNDSIDYTMCQDSNYMNSQFDEKFHSYLKELYNDLIKWYAKTNNPYYMKKFELCEQILNGDESPFTLALLYDFVSFQFAYVMRAIKSGEKHSFNLKLQKIFSYLKNELEKPNVNRDLLININSKNDYSY